MIVYVVIEEDKHIDIEFHIFSIKEKALEKAEDLVKEYSDTYEDEYEEANYEGLLFCKELDDCGSIKVIEKTVLDIYTGVWYNNIK